MKGRVRVAAASVLAVLAALAVPGGSSRAHAGGQLVPGLGTQAQPRAGAFHAKADDPSALYYNPAGFAFQTGTQLHLGFNLLSFDQSFRRAGSYPQTDSDHAWEGEPFPEVENRARPHLGIGRMQSIPTFALSTGFGTKLPIRFGIGVFAAHGYASRDFSSGYVFEDPTQAPPPQRYDVMRQDAWAIFPSAALAWSVTDKLAVGARASWGIGGLRALTYTWATRNYEESPSHEGVYDLAARDNFIPTFGLGLLYRPLPFLELGATYRSAAHVRAVGAGAAMIGSRIGLAGRREFVVAEQDMARCRLGGQSDSLATCIDFELPQEAVVAARWVLRDGSARERGDLEFDVQWEDWSAASDIRVRVDGRSGLLGLPLGAVTVKHGWSDTFSFRLGGSYAFPLGDSRLIVRGGAAYDTAAAPLRWTRADMDGFERVTLGGGLGLELDRFRIDVGVGTVLEPTRRVAAACPPSMAAGSGCAPDGGQTPVGQRTAPDPVQPLQHPESQLESPFNAGEYRQGYLLFSLGLTAYF